MFFSTTTQPSPGLPAKRSGNGTGCGVLPDICEGNAEMPTEHAREPMQDDPLAAFLEALPAGIRQRVNRTDRFVALVHRAVNNGWTAKQLAAECTRSTTGVLNAAGLVAWRLEQAADHGPTTPSGQRRIPFCTPQCRDNAGWIEDDDGNPVRRCECRKGASA